MKASDAEAAGRPAPAWSAAGHLVTEQRQGRRRRFSLRAPDGACHRASARAAALGRGCWQLTSALLGVGEWPRTHILRRSVPAGRSPAVAEDAATDPRTKGRHPTHVIGSAVPHSAAHEASLSLTSRADRGGYAIAALSGELGIASAPALREQLLSLLRSASHLIIDLSAVEHADASGLAVLVGSGRRARLLGGSLRLAAPSPEVARVLSATGINQHLDIFPTVRAAIVGHPEESQA